ncbi:unnamed protein product, partial [Mesorhabditis belari]|uniref:Uncharacterized protein n=1 Tax=Mesorhabditis belari TaxID=2138241 RepID=A0AAF3JA80_9BILA
MTRLFLKWILIFLFFATITALHPIYETIKKKQIPKAEDGGPLQVKVGFYVESMGNFRSTEMTFDMDLYMYMSWVDPAMAHNESDYVLINDADVLKSIWLPDLYFANARTAYFHEVMVHNFNMFVSPTGIIAYGTRVTLNVACNLHLKDYPLDSQKCLVKIISYAHVETEMKATWFEDGAIRMNKEIGLPEYNLGPAESLSCSGEFHYTITHNSSRIGNFSCLVGVLSMKRAIGYHLVQSYIPTGLIVAISWVSFWIDRRAVPARVSLSFTTLLTLSTQGNGIRYGLPPVSYAKAIDFFYGTCMLFIFGVLLEFAVVNSYMRKAHKFGVMADRSQSSNEENGRHIVCGTDGEADYEDSPRTRIHVKTAGHYAILVCKSLQFSRKAHTVDQISRFAFPASFIIFNIIYWTYYLSEDRQKNEDEVIYV